MGSILRRAGLFGRHALARRRRVRGVTLTRLTDSQPNRFRARCGVRVAISATRLRLTVQSFIATLAASRFDAIGRLRPHN
jgi:hypothetical protein